MDYKQEKTSIGDVEVPIVTKGEDVYYPLSYIDKNILIKNRGFTKNKISDADVVSFKINFGDGNIQISNCVKKEVLIDAISRSNTQRLDIEDRKNQNILREHLGITKIETKKNDFDYYNLNWCRNYDYLTRVAIEESVNNGDKNVKARRCSGCEKIFPLNDDFFVFSKGTFERRCLECRVTNNNKESVKYRIKNEYIGYLFKYGDISRIKRRALVKSYIEKDYYTLHKAYRNNEIKRLPDDFYTKEWYLEIVKKLIENEGLILKDVSMGDITKTFKLSNNKHKIKQHELYCHFFDQSFVYNIWNYPSFRFDGFPLTFDIVKENFNNYLKEFGIKIENPFEFDYDKIIRKCHLTGIYKKIGGVCEFFVKYWDGQYAGYQFRHIGNYYRNSEKNVESDLRYLIEKDLQLKTEKIPLYITKSLLFKQAKPLHNHIVIKKNGSIFESINKLYPDRFIEADFTIGNYRNDFDSVEEQQVDDVIREYFKNVVYNFNTSNQVVELFDKRPDWFIFTEKGIWLVEYFGMYIPKQGDNSIVKEYMTDTEKKKELYKRLKGYNFLFVYPTDLENNFKGLRDKLEEIKRKVL